MNIDYLWTYQVLLEYPVTIFDERYQHSGLTYTIEKLARPKIQSKVS